MGILEKMKNKLDAAQEKLEKMDLPKFSETAEYMGGHKDLTKAGKINIVGYKDRIELQQGFKKAIIKVDNIISAEVKTEEQIEKDVTLTRLLLVGIFAFGLKKKRKYTSNYVIITFQDGIECKVILKLDKADKANKLISNIIKLKSS